MQKFSNYQKKVFTLQQTLKWNLYTDYEGQFTDQNAQNVLSLFLRVFEHQNPHQREKQYEHLKSKITDPQELAILQWFERQRGQKYFGESLPKHSLIKKYKSINTCPNPDFLDPTRVIGFSKSVPIQQKAPLDPITIKDSYFALQRQPTSNKTFLYRKVRERLAKPSPWVVQITKDHRYIWRASIAIDRNDVSNLLRFILMKRSKNDECPSILINTGSHGDILGKTASDVGDFGYTAQFIRDQTLNSLYQMIENDGPSIRLNKNNTTKKVCIYFLSSVTPCIYPQRADHIIDTQCFGAYMPIEGFKLHHTDSLIIQEDLNFLSLEKKQKEQTHKKQQETIQPKIQNQVTPITQNIWDLMKDLIITQPMKKLIQDSVIIKNQFDAYKLINFFKFKQKKGFFSSVPKVKKITDLKLLFRASEHHFNIRQYFKLYGQEQNTFFICLTEKDKIIGAYSPFSHQYKSSFFVVFDGMGKWVEDSQRESFVFSVTNNEKFILKTPSRAIYRMKDKSLVVFGGKDFSICDKANKIKESVTNINFSYFNPTYEQTDLDKFSPESCLRFNGNDDVYFLIKQWEVWKIQMEYVDFGLIGQ